MSTDVDAPPAEPAPDKRRRLPSRYVWLAAALVIVLGGLGAVYGLGAFGEDDLPGAAGEEGFQAQLTAKVVNLLEQMPPEQHGHKHGNNAGPTKLICGARVFGVQPAGTDQVAEVAVAYGYHICAVVQPGVEWIMAVKMTGPMIVTLAADPPTVTTVEGGQGFRERVRSLFPEQYHNDALRESLTVEGVRELTARYNAATDGAKSQ